jgi:hypothetical protein
MGVGTSSYYVKETLLTGQLPSIMRRYLLFPCFRPMFDKISKSCFRAEFILVY